MLTSEENDYFLRSFEALGVAPEIYETAAQGPVTRAFSELLVTSAGNGTYEEGVACLLCAEWTYLSWGLREAKNPRPEQFWLAEWIDLHAVAGFESFVNWIQEEMDRVGAALDESAQEKLAQLFRDMSALEQAFFDAAWTGNPSLPGEFQRT